MVKRKRPLIHCITNQISINQCANVILAVGARPVMAEHPKEVCEITDTADGLMLNIGNITDARMESGILSVKTAMVRNIPVLLDVVDVALTVNADDLLLDNNRFIRFKGKRIDNPNTHGTGCTLSSAVASNLAKGLSLEMSVKKAKNYIADALAEGLDLGKGSGPLMHNFGLNTKYST